MNEKVKEKLQKLKEFFKKLSKKVYIIAAVILILIAAVIAFALNNKPYAVLVTGVTADEAQSILTYLDGLGVTEYKVENQDTILVPEGQETNLKAKLMMEGYPQTGFSYSPYYDHVGALSTESERNKSYLLLIQDRMGAVIRCMDNVKDAKVTITPGEDRGYILDSGNVVEASAGVMVTMNGTSKLTSKQAEAIRNYVAHSVQGLQVEKVSISDTQGNNYNLGGEETGEGASSLKLKLEEEWENKIRTEVLQVLTPFFGEENVRVGVNCVVDVSKVTEERTDVFLPEWAQDGSTGGRGVIGVEKNDYYAQRPGDGGIGGLVGSETNSDIPVHMEDIADPRGDETALGGGNQVEYDNPRSEQHIISNSGVLKDCTVSVSLNAKAAESVDVQEVRQHVARAAGIQGEIDPETGEENLTEQISIMTMDFQRQGGSRNPSRGFQVEPWMIAAGAGGFLLLFLLLFLLMRRRKKKKAVEEAGLPSEQDLEALLAERLQTAGAAANAGADVMSLQSEKSMELRKDIRQFANDNPEIAAQQIKSWLRGGEDDG